jgi:hypothetical protein
VPAHSLISSGTVRCAVTRFGLILLVGWLAGGTLRAQQWEVGGGLGVLHYKGDLSPALHPAFARPGGHLFGRYHFSDAVSVRAQGTLGTVFADESALSDPLHRARALRFRSRVAEVSGLFEYNFLKYDYTRRGQRNWTPYIFAGLGLFNFSPDTPPTAQYRRTGLVLPFGLGAKWQVKGPWNVALEFGTRQTWTDYLDNFGGDGLGTGQLQRPDPTRRDMYYYTSLTLSYTFLRVVCPD